MESLHPLDNPVLASLTGPHAGFAIRRGNVLFYPAEVSPFFVLPQNPSPADWADVAAVVGPGGIVPLAGVEVPPPDGWTVVMTGEGIQLVDDGVAAVPDPAAIRLGARRVKPPRQLIHVQRRISHGCHDPEVSDAVRHDGPTEPDQHRARQLDGPGADRMPGR